MTPTLHERYGTFFTQAVAAIIFRGASEQEAATLKAKAVAKVDAMIAKHSGDQEAAAAELAAELAAEADAIRERRAAPKVAILKPHDR